jgi:pyruvate,water dikinase
LEALDKSLAGQAGNKMANLGEVKNHLGLSVPEGFVITAAAYERVMEFNRLPEEINRRIQSLDPADIAGLHEVSSEIQQLILRAAMPPEVEEAVLSAYRQLMQKTGPGTRVSLRSSALGEDAQGASFAGQYRSVLNVDAEYLILSYKEVLASKYSVPAMAYRLNKGFLDEDIIMCVGCMAMVRAAAGGVMYTADPGDPQKKRILINAVLGLGKAVVDGSLIPDLLVVDKEDPDRIVEKEVRRKTRKTAAHPEEGTYLEVLAESEQQVPAISDEQAQALARTALDLEMHFGCPQDIEWAVLADGSIQILQSRPLLIPREQAGLAERPVRPGPEQPPILEGGITASPGAACGPVFLVETTVDMLRFPPGAVLVARIPLPQWAALLSRAVAVVTEEGALTGHLAAVAREFKIPALMAAQGAGKILRQGELITVEADQRRIYAGRVEALLSQRAAKASPMKGSPVYRRLENILKLIAPLNLTDPESENFRPAGCRTLHDIIRFAHEMSLQELFEGNKGPDFSQAMAKKLDS